MHIVQALIVTPTKCQTRKAAWQNRFVQWLIKLISECQTPKTAGQIRFVQWLIEKVDSGEFQPKNVEFYMVSINKYIKGEINLRWKDGDLVVE